MVSVKSTDGNEPEGTGGCESPLVGALRPAALKPAGLRVDVSFAPVGLGTVGSALAASNFTALLEMTNRRRTGGAFNFGGFGLLLRMVSGVFFAAVTLRFNINIQTNESAMGSENHS